MQRRNRRKAATASGENQTHFIVKARPASGPTPMPGNPNRSGRPILDSSTLQIKANQG